MMGTLPIAANLQAHYLQPIATLSRESLSQQRTTNSVHFPETLPFGSVSAVDALSSCAFSRNAKLGSCLHSKILKFGLNDNVFINNALLDMYIKNELLQDAQKLFDLMPERTVVTWTSMVSGYSRRGLAQDAMLAFFEMLENHIRPNEFTLAAILHACSQGSDHELARVVHGYVMKSRFGSDEFLQNSLVGVYAKCGKVEEALKILRGFSLKNVVAWTSLVSGYVLNGMVEEAVRLFFRMKKEGVEPNEVTLLSILQACSLLKQENVFRWAHGVVMKLGFYGNDLVLNSLVEMYLVNGCLYEGIKVFYDIGFGGRGQYLTPETIASLLQNCANWGFMKLGEALHGYLAKHGFFPCVIIENSLIDMYGEDGQSDSAVKVFSRMKKKDIISWNSLATCFVKNGRFHEALKLLKEACRSENSNSESPDFVMMLMAVQACSNLASLQLGEAIHGYMTRAGMTNDMFIQNALLDMYGRTGRLDLAEKVFDEIPVKDTGSYNSLIAAYGHNGNVSEALSLFSGLQKSETCKPNAITFTNILSACSHAGMIKEGFEIFSFMRRQCKIAPSMEHYACMVDLLGRSGRLKEAESFIQKMPVKPNKDVWGALLGACGFSGNVDIAEKAARELSFLEPENSTWRVALSNAYASVGRWEDAAKVRAQIKGVNGIQREGGWSRVEIDGESFRFMVNDTRHPESEMIYMVLSTMKEHTANETHHQMYAFDYSP